MQFIIGYFGELVLNKRIINLRLKILFFSLVEKYGKLMAWAFNNLLNYLKNDF